MILLKMNFMHRKEFSMKLYDISQEVFSSKVYPGDMGPSAERTLRIQDGDICNLTNLCMCTHNGTHVDAPLHFLDSGEGIETLDLYHCVGDAFVLTTSNLTTSSLAADGLASDDLDVSNQNLESFSLNRSNIREMLARRSNNETRILIKGNVVLSPEAAEELASTDIVLIGVEGLSVASDECAQEVHSILLKQGLVILEGLDLHAVDEGAYFLSAAPLNLAGSDGSPCRAFLISW